VIINLAVNARDAMPNGGLLKITAGNTRTESGEYVKITIADTGSGMTPEVQARAFEPFFTTKETGRGTGLGLSQVYGFVKQSRGNATLESHLDKGTSVTLMLPRAHGETRAREAAEMIGSDPSPSRVLIVEDDDDVAAVVSDMVEELGHRAMRVGSAREALEKLERGEEFDLVFSDIIMPGGVSGADLAQDIQRRFPDIPVVLTTGYSGASIPADYMGAVLRKPYRPQDLAKAIAEARNSIRA
jgi:CheY-like chemotaxis protein